jgi:hypothetical protein
MTLVAQYQAHGEAGVDTVKMPKTSKQRQKSENSKEKVDLNTKK